MPGLKNRRGAAPVKLPSQRRSHFLDPHAQSRHPDGVSEKTTPRPAFLISTVDLDRRPAERLRAGHRCRSPIRRNPRSADAKAPAGFSMATRLELEVRRSRHDAAAGTGLHSGCKAPDHC